MQCNAQCPWYMCWSRLWSGHTVRWLWHRVPYTMFSLDSTSPLSSQEKSANRPPHTVIRFVWVSDKFGTCTVVSVNGTFVEAKMCLFTLNSTHFIFNKCPVDTHDGANAKFSTNSHETDYSAGGSLTASLSPWHLYLCLDASFLSLN